MDFLVGTFYTPKVFTLRFTAPSTLETIHVSEACGGHSWLTLSPDHKFLYTTVWAEPAAVAAYAIQPDATIKFLNSKPIRAMSGYVVASPKYLYSAGGPSGEVFEILADGSLGELVQELQFRDEGESKPGNEEQVAHGNFGGLRHGSHSVDFSPDGKSLYIADIGHNCIWSYTVTEADDKSNKPPPPLSLGMKWIAPRHNDGPRHTWPHPNGKYLYCLQEHSSMVDILSIGPDGTTLTHVSGVKIIPKDKDAKEYWADEVRLSRPSPGSTAPAFLYASTRGLDKETMGYVAAFALDENGLIKGNEALDIYQTSTSGGIANAIEPAPGSEAGSGVEYLALTDSQEGYVFVLSFDGHRFAEAARTRLVGDDGKGLTSATAVWL